MDVYKKKKIKRGRGSLAIYNYKWWGGLVPTPLTHSPHPPHTPHSSQPISIIHMYYDAFKFDNLFNM